MGRIFSAARRLNGATILLIAVFFGLLLSACLSPQVSQTDVEITIHVKVDDEIIPAGIPAGSTVEQALKIANVITGALDRVEPPAYTVLQDGDSVTITRVTESFETEQITLPFERQTIRNESMPAGETRLIQPGVNGAQEITIRHVFENGIEIGNSAVKSVTLQNAQPEIMMIGAQSAFAPLAIPGKLIYIAGGNAWLMEGSTANRVPIVTSGDLDGRVLSLSADGKWLLYTRKSTAPPEKEINTLYALNIEQQGATPINLKVHNVVHFAAWVPNAKLQVAFSTVEPRAAAPGWQANNNLIFMLIGENGNLGIQEKIIDTNSGGVYGWWGTNFVWSPTGANIAYARPDGIGLVNVKDKTLIDVLAITPLQTRSEWALIPGIAWGADGRSLYAVTHAPPPNLVNPEESPYFDLRAFSLDSGADVRIVAQSGMFAYPASSSLRQRGSEKNYMIAYLKAILPALSETSGYRLMIMDRDGSEQRALFPPEGSQGLDPQTPVWAPFPIAEDEGDFIAVIYQQNLWLIDVATGEARQITGDGLITKIEWK